MSRHEGRTAVITGAALGLGWECARRPASERARGSLRQVVVVTGSATAASRASSPQKHQRVAPCGSAVATPNTVRAVSRKRCHGGGPALGALYGAVNAPAGR